MSTATMPNQYHLTSLLGEHDQLRQNYQFLMPRDNGMQNHHDVHDINGYSGVPSGSSTSYSSPQPGQVFVDEYNRPHTVVGENEFGVYRQYVSLSCNHNAGERRPKDADIKKKIGHPEPVFCPYQNTTYPQPPQQPQYGYPLSQVYSSSPATSDSDLGGRQRPTTRQTRGRAINDSSDRSPSPFRRRKAAKPKDKAKRATLEEPLSVLTKHLEDVKIKDTEAWVNRSPETRRKEIGNDGAIKRPSNSFILYRSAYADRCRTLQKSTNHQDISSIAGASWAIELPEIRAKYEEWAKTERQNHQAAFPDYKFQPQTQATKDRKRKGRPDEASDEPSDTEDPTYNNGRGGAPARGRSIRTKKTRQDYREPSYTSSSVSQEDVVTPEPYSQPMHDSSHWQYVSPAKPMPTAMGRMPLPGTYYQTTSHPNQGLGHLGPVEEVEYWPAETPAAYHDSLSPPMGMPGASHDDLMGVSMPQNAHMTFSESLDPSLVTQDLHYPEPARGDTPLTARSFHFEQYLKEHGDAAMGSALGHGEVDVRYDTNHFDDTP